MENGLPATVDMIRASLSSFVPELLLAGGVFLMILAGLIRKNQSFLSILVVIILTASLALLPWKESTFSFLLFNGMVRSDNFSAYLRALIDVAALFTVLMTWRHQHTQKQLSEYYALVIAVVLGAHLLVMSMNLLMVFLSLEMISISSYVLAGFSFTKKGAEGSLKYFLFGSVASAVMLYGMSLFYGFTGSLDFTTSQVLQKLLPQTSPLFFIAGLMVLSGFLYKMAAAPLHPWAPDVYEASPMPVVAFFSTVPKLAGVGVLTKFMLAVSLVGQTTYDWQAILSVVAILTLTVGNFSALWQKNTKRLMAYSSIAQSGFLLVGVAAFLPLGTQYMLFYATVYVLMNFLIFLYLQYFEKEGLETIASFQGTGKHFVWPSIFMLTGFISLTGLPPTSGFTGKLFIFSSLWESYQLSGKPILIWLLVFGLLNTVVSLFYYLRIPYYAFIKSGESSLKANNLTLENFFGLVLVILLLILFFSPGLLMGWINKITFVLDYR